MKYNLVFFRRNKNGDAFRVRTVPSNRIPNSDELICLGDVIKSDGVSEEYNYYKIEHKVLIYCDGNTSPLEVNLLLIPTEIQF